MCVLSLCVCFVVVVVVRLAVLFVCASAWYRYVVRLGGDSEIVQFGRIVEIVIGRRDHSYYRGHRRRNHLYDNHNHHRSYTMSVCVVPSQIETDGRWLWV